MNIFNRVVITLLLLALAMMLVVFMVAPAGLMRELEADFGLVGDFLEDLGITFLSFTWGWFFTVLMGLGTLVVVLLLLYLELRRPAQRAAAVLGVSTGQVQVATESIARRLEYHLQEVAGVMRVRPAVRGSRRGVEVRLEVELSPDIDIPAKAEEICRLAQEVVENKMGLQLEKEVQVRIRHASYAVERLKPRPMPRPAAPPTPPPTAPKPEEARSGELPTSDDKPAL